jgi:hypothetical protein
MFYCLLPSFPKAQNASKEAADNFEELLSQLPILFRNGINKKNAPCREGGKIS